MTTEPTQPLTDEELTEIRKSSEWAISANNAMRLLAEVDRLRMELETKSVVHQCCEEVVELKKDRAHLKDALADATAEDSRLRAENTAQARQLDAVRAIEPRQRTGLTTPTLLAEVSGWNGAVATLRAALGLDQDEEGQANG